MKALIAKELQENAKVGVAALLAFTLLVLGVGLSYSRFISNLALGQSPPIDWTRLHPLSSAMFLMAVGSFCGVFGALLGWLQIHHEKHRDLWAFLIHRPVARGHIFWAKVFAGLILYIVAAGLPLCGFLFWMSLPGNVAAPFDWAMSWPLAASLFLGIVWYFAGMLTRLREARWYASRALGLGVAVMATGAAVGRWWVVGLVIAACLLLLALAVWGGFHSHGHYESQPKPGKIALTASLALGTLVLIALAMLLIFSLFPAFFAPEAVSNYVMMQDGTICKQIYRGGNWQTVDLQGKPVTNAYTWQGTFHLAVNFEPQKESSPLTQAAFTYWSATPETIWFYWTRYGRLVGYNLATRRLVGSLGPDGFSPRRHGNDRFSGHSKYVPGAPYGTLHTVTAVYQADIHKRTSRALFVTTNNDPIGAAGTVLDERFGFAVVTRKWVQLIAPDGTTRWRIPFERPSTDYTDVRISILESPEQFAVWVGPSHEADAKNPGKLPMHVTWLKTGDIVKRTELPPLRPARLGNSLTDTFIAAVAPPAVMLAFLFDDKPMPWNFAIISLTSALLISFPAGAFFGRRYKFSANAQIGWAFFHLLLGLPGFLAFLAVHDWPARERCAACNKLRVVSRQNCEHCGAEFPAPAKDGTEIFEPLVTSPVE